MFVVDGASATPAQAATLAEAGLQERAHLQEWIIARPEILGEDLLIITAEYDRWEGSGGAMARDRLDVLAVEPTGRLVVAELKREEDRRVHIQAITYAALVSTFTPESLAHVYSEFSSKRGLPLTPEEARRRLDEHVTEGWDEELLRRPRIVLVAATYPRTVTHTAVWLSELGLDISLIEVSAWRLNGGDLVVGFDVLYPTPAVSDFTLLPARAEARAVTERAKERSRAASTARILVAAGVLAEGTPLAIAPTHGVTTAEREKIRAWVEEDPRRGRATWHQDATQCLRWQADNKLWRPTSLARHIIEQSVGRHAAVVRGPVWWVTETGDDLVAIAESVSTAGDGRFDWSALHRVLRRLPTGKWTTYGDLASIVGTDARPLGVHILNCADCINGERVLRYDGRLAANFRWTTGRTDDPRVMLEQQGVRFDPTDRADSTQRLSLEELSVLAELPEDLNATVVAGRSDG